MMEKRTENGISADALKVIALLTMLIDHVGAALLTNVTILRLIGRISFPIYAWLLVMGFVHTSSRKKYMLNMGACALLSEIPFDLAFYNELTLSGQNIYFSLLWGLLLMTVLEKVLDGAVKKEDAGNLPGNGRYVAAKMPEGAVRRKPGVARAVWILVVLLLFMAVARLLRFDYSCTGPVLVTVFYLYYRTGRPQLASGFLLFSFSYLAAPLLDGLFNGGLWTGALRSGNVWRSAFSTVLVECFGIMAVPFISRYNGVRRWKRGKAFFYLFYPLHLLVLYAIRRLFF